MCWYVFILAIQEPHVIVCNSQQLKAKMYWLKRWTPYGSCFIETKIPVATWALCKEIKALLFYSMVKDKIWKGFLLESFVPNALEKKDTHIVWEFPGLAI